MASDGWDMIHAERAALAGDLTGITTEQWAVPSLCSDWTVHQVLGHIVATTTMTPARFFARFAGAGAELHAVAVSRLFGRRLPVHVVRIHEVPGRWCRRGRRGALAVGPAIGPARLVGAWGRFLLGIDVHDVCSRIGNENCAQKAKGPSPVGDGPFEIS